MKKFEFASLSLALLAVLAAACGDNLERAPDAGAADASTDAGVAPVRAVIVAGDFVPGHPGVMSVMDVATRTVKQNVAPAGAIGEDPVLRRVGSELLVVNRASGNNVTILDATTFALVAQLGTGAGTNPQDVAVVGQKLVVATLGNKGAVVLTRGSSTVTEIDLSADDPDHKPNCSSVFATASKVYVACGLLDDTNQNLPPRGPGKVYVLDPNTFAITATLTLTTKNPIALFEQLPDTASHPGDLLLPTIDFGTGAGCVERISTTGTPAAAGCLIDNATLGAFAFASRLTFYAPPFTGPAARIVPTPIMYLAISSYPMGSARGYDASLNTLWPAALTPATQVVGDVVGCPTGDIVVADNPPPPSTAPNGLRVYQNTELTTTALPIGLKPASSHGLVCY